MANKRITYIDDSVSSELLLNDYLRNEFPEFNWEIEKNKADINIDTILHFLEKDSLAVLLPANKAIYPLPENIVLVSIFGGGENIAGGFVLLTFKGKETKLKSFLTVDKRKYFGKVFIAGFGPGDWELLTLKTHRLLNGADIIFYDDLLDSTYLDQFNCEKYYVGKRKGKHSAKQDIINEKLYKAALQGKQVVRLKGGDPLVFGRGGEEYHYLAKRFIEVEIIPGITSALAAAADGVIPLTSRGISTSVAFTLGHDAIYNKLPKADTLVFFMGAAQQKKWALRLIHEGWLKTTPVAAVRNASLPGKEIKRYTLEQLIDAEKVLPAPCLVIVGNTASHDIRAQGKKWLFTGSDINDFKEKGVVTHNPMIAFKNISPDLNSKQVLKNLSLYSRILFPSPIAVKMFFETLYSLNIDTRAIANIKLSSMGDSTSAELKKYGLLVVPESDKNSSEELIKKFIQRNVKGEKILIPSSIKGLSYLPKALKELGNEVESLALYENVLPENAVKHNLDEFYGVVFTSPTSVHNFFKVYDYFPTGIKTKAKGNITRKILEEYLGKIKG